MVRSLRSAPPLQAKPFDKPSVEALVSKWVGQAAEGPEQPEAYPGLMDSGGALLFDLDQVRFVGCMG